MAKKDHLDKELAVSAKLTPTGLHAKAKLRTLAAIDRFFGTLVDRWNTPREIETAEMRAVAEGRLAIIEAAAKSAVKRAATDPEYAEEVLGAAMAQFARRHENKRGVLEAAVTDLKNEPPSESQSATGDDALNEEFMTRLERHAEDAGTQALRERWGKVLAAEIRDPGSITPRSIRVIDELDPATQALFEQLCQNRLVNGIPHQFASNLKFGELKSLVEAGLIIEPGLAGHVSNLQEVETESGKKVYVYREGVAGLSFQPSQPLNLDGDGVLKPSGQGRFGISLLLFTSVGRSIARIFSAPGERVFEELALSIAHKTGAATFVHRYDAMGKITNTQPIIVSSNAKAYGVSEADQNNSA